MEKEVNLLIIAVDFPPYNSAGAYRPFYFAKYLSELGVNVTVFAVDLSSESQSNNLELLKELPSNVSIEWLENPKQRLEKISTGLKGKLFHFFKTDDLWALLLKKEVKQKFRDIIKKYKINEALITIPPFSIPRLFIPLLKEFRIPFVLDMRDHYSLWRPTPYTTYFHYISIRNTEKYYLKSAASVIVVSSQMKSDLEYLYKSNVIGKINVIPNGIDHPISKSSYTTIPIDHYSQKYIIGYSGSFYYQPKTQDEIFTDWWKRKGHKKLYFVERNRIEDWKYRSPYFFFKALNALFEIAPELKNKIEFHYAGNQPDWLIDQLNEFNLIDIYKYQGYLNSREIKEFHLSCDAYLMTSVKVIGGKDYCIASKTFSYLEGGKPILGFVTEGEQQNILKNIGTSIIFNPDRSTENAYKLKDFLYVSRKFETNDSLNEIYLRKVQSINLLKILKSLY